MRPSNSSRNCCIRLCTDQALAGRQRAPLAVGRRRRSSDHRIETADVASPRPGQSAKDPGLPRGELDDHRIRGSAGREGSRGRMRRDRCSSTCRVRARHLPAWTGLDRAFDRTHPGTVGRYGAPIYPSGMGHTRTRVRVSAQHTRQSPRYGGNCREAAGGTYGAPFRVGRRQEQTIWTNLKRVLEASETSPSPAGAVIAALSGQPTTG